MLELNRHNFFEPPRKTKIGSKIGEFEKSGVKQHCSIEERKRFLVRIVGRSENNKGSRNRDFTVLVWQRKTPSENVIRKMHLKKLIASLLL